jgi:hypothetical protein
MAALEGANLALRFLLELAALAAVGYWGWKTGSGATRPLLAVASVSSVVVVWALFIRPHPTVKLAGPLRLLLEFAVWTAAGAALYATGNPRLGIAFVAVAFASGALNYRWK